MDSADVTVLMRDRALRLVFALVIAVGMFACTPGPGSGGTQAPPAASPSPAAASPSSSGGSGEPGEYGEDGY